MGGWLSVSTDTIDRPLIITLPAEIVDASVILRLGQIKLSEFIRFPGEFHFPAQS
jgi:hypothetical protein